MIIDDTINILNWYTDLENNARAILDIIPYKEKNFYSEIPKIAPLIVEAGSLISTIHQLSK